MTTLRLTPDELLTTTRAVRKRLDLERPLELGLVRECLEVALQAPTGSNAQGWHFVLVSDTEKRRRIAELYAQAFEGYRSMPFSAHAIAEQREGAEQETMHRVVDSAEYLAANLERVPVFLIPCIEGRFDQLPPPMANMAQASVFGSILPAVWSFMLAGRARGLGTAWTTLHLNHEEAVAEILGIPYAQVTQVALVPVAHTLGTNFRPAPRRSLDAVLHLDAW
jgi:nitroreductase